MRKVRRGDKIEIVRCEDAEWESGIDTEDIQWALDNNPHTVIYVDEGGWVQLEDDYDGFVWPPQMQKLWCGYKRKWRV
jgi:hypothetical protein